jgi:serine/threonine-protein kinase
VNPRPELRAVLSECPTFKELSEDLVQQIFECMEERRLASDELLIKQGEPGDCLYVVAEGDLEVRVRDADKGEHAVGKIERGGLVGEMALLTKEPRTADVRASTGALVLTLPADDFERLISRNIELAVVLTDLLAERLGRAAQDGLGGKTLHGFRIKRSIGRGGTAVVYEAEQVETGDQVALKMMSHSLIYQSGALARFRQEAELIGGLVHDRITCLKDEFPAYKTHFLAMELVSGPPLDDIIKHHGGLGEAETRKIVGQIAEALIYLHAQGVIHRDLKPGNVLVSRDGWCKLTDFGLAKHDPLDGEATMTMAGGLYGTPSYMAPEQLSGLEANPSTDVYALAAIAYALLTGERLFKGEDLMTLIEERLLLELPPASELAGGIGEDLHAFMTNALKRKPEERDVDLEALTAWSGPIDEKLLQGDYWGMGTES